MKRTSLVFILILLMALNLSAARVPVIYGTDLFHPHDDPDDHFDLATLFALPELEVKAILLDQGEKQLQRPGAIPLEQMMRLTGRRVPFAIGLARKLASPADDGRDQPARFQAAVDLLLKTLRESPEPVTIIAAGSVRDIAAAWNREPALMKRKAARLYLNIGNADRRGSEYNVDLDPQAYVGLLRSGLPLYLCFCMPMAQPAASNALYSTWWRFRQSEVLASAPRELQNYFIYALQRCAPEELDPQKALPADLRPWRRLVWEMDRNMWCTASFLHAAGRNVRETSGGWTAAGGGAAGGGSAPFTFVPARLEVDGTGKTAWQAGVTNANIQLFKVLSAERYSAAMRDCLRELLNSVATQ
jgi:hypothetical protein